MIRLFCVLTGSLILALCLDVQAQGEPYLSEQAVLTAAKAKYPLIIAAEAQVEKASADYLASKGHFDPAIRSEFIGSPNGTYKNNYSLTELSLPINDTGYRLFTGYRIGTGNFPVYDQNRETYNAGEVNLGVEFPLLRNKNIDTDRANISEKFIREKISNEDKRLLELTVQRDAAIQYWIWYTEGQKKRVYESLLNLAQSRQAAIEKSASIGDLAKIDVFDNERLIEERKALLTNQTVVFQKSAWTLSLFYRDSKGKPIVPSMNLLSPSILYVPSSPTTLPSNQWLALINQTPQLKKLQQENALNQIKLDLAHNNFKPLLNSRLYLAQDFGGGNAPLNRTSINYQLNFEWPIFQREARGEILAAQQLFNKNREEQKMATENGMVQLQAAIAQLKTSLAIIKINIKQLQLAEKVENAERLRFKEGDSNLFMLNQREQSTVHAKTQYLEALGGYYMEKANLHFIMANF